jgi:hypothetical protein
MSNANQTEVIKEPSMIMQKELIASNYEALTSAHENGKKVVSTFVPGNLNELIRCFDLLNNLPEINAINNGMRKKSGSMIMDAEKSGHSEDVCTYVKSDIGMMSQGNIAPNGKPMPDAAPRRAAALLHRLLHVHEVVRAAAPRVQVPDADAAGALPGRRQDHAEHDQLRRQAAQGGRHPRSGGGLRRQVRHRPAARDDGALGAG